MATFSVSVTFIRKRWQKAPFAFVNGQCHAITRNSTVTYFANEDMARDYVREMTATYGHGLYSIVLAQVLYCEGGNTAVALSC
jgi:hypothetical protein